MTDHQRQRHTSSHLRRVLEEEINQYRVEELNNRLLVVLDGIIKENTEMNVFDDKQDDVEEPSRFNFPYFDKRQQQQQQQQPPQQEEEEVVDAAEYDDKDEVISPVMDVVDGVSIMIYPDDHDHRPPATDPPNTFNNNNNHQIAYNNAIAAAAAAAAASEMNLTFAPRSALNGTTPMTGVVNGTTVYYTTSYSVTPVGYFMISLLSIVFALSVGALLWRLWKRREFRIQFEQGYQPRGKATIQRIQRRYETIEHWIISKQVLDHDEFCAKCVRNFDHHHHHHHYDQQQHNDVVTEVTTETSAGGEAITTETLEVEDTTHFGNGLEQPPTQEAEKGPKDDTDEETSKDEKETSALNTNTDNPIDYNNNCQTTTITPLPLEEEDDDDDVHHCNEDCNHYCPEAIEVAGTTSTTSSSRNATTSKDWSTSSSITAKSDPMTDVDCSESSTASSLEERECPVCMSPLQVGNIVSWSANDLCTHVYHHECIKEWLLRHTECCLCKHIILPVDLKRGKAKEQALQALSAGYAAASSTSYYCIQEGLVRIPQTVKCTRRELKLLEDKIFCGAVAPVELAGLRGRRQEATCRNPLDEDDDEHIQIIETAATSATAADTTRSSVIGGGGGGGDLSNEDGVNLSSMSHHSNQDKGNHRLRQQASTALTVSSGHSDMRGFDTMSSSGESLAIDLDNTNSSIEIDEEYGGIAEVSIRLPSSEGAENDYNNYVDMDTSNNSGAYYESCNEELILASNHLAQNSPMSDNRCRILENKDSAEEQGVEVAGTVNLPVLDDFAV